MMRLILFPSLVFSVMISVLPVEANEVLYFTNDTNRPMILKVYSYSAHRWRDDIRFASQQQTRPVNFNSDEMYYMLLRDDRGIDWPLGPYNITKVCQQSGKYLEVRLSVITLTVMCVPQMRSPTDGCCKEPPDDTPAGVKYLINWYRWPKPPQEHRFERVPSQNYHPAPGCSNYSCPFPCCW